MKRRTHRNNTLLRLSASTSSTSSSSTSSSSSSSSTSSTSSSSSSSFPSSSPPPPPPPLNYTAGLQLYNHEQVDDLWRTSMFRFSSRCWTRAAGSDPVTSVRSNIWPPGESSSCTIQSVQTINTVQTINSVQTINTQSRPSTLSPDHQHSVQTINVHNILVHVSVLTYRTYSCTRALTLLCEASPHSSSSAHAQASTRPELLILLRVCA
ncbi:hypothetical protein EYF80_051581 [Liparis tanakae]|uniref:Uncharacterized protein n=1 Tax=Liparis tanakae TaxID=230148 RepID=A0A4Z2FAP3_9TELE|nr:hypothetical protein EYF80_051581 [Liparis tanakae]